MTLDTLKQRLKLLIGRVRNDYWPRLRRDVATREPRSLFFRALLIGFLLSVPWQCTRMAYNAIFTGDETETVENEQSLNAPHAGASITGMPNPKAKRPVMQSAPPASLESPADMAETPGQAIQPASVAQADQDARLVERKALDYPLESLRKGETGSVTIRVRIDAGGEPVAADIEQSSGFRNLDRAARKAVMRWKYAPKIEHGNALESEILVPVDFKIGN